MELNWSTFILEIINFLVLVWILKRFLYKPVTEVIARRRAAIEKSLADAQTMQAEAQTRKGQYENRLADWEREREKARLQLLDESKAERARLMAALQAELAQEREKNQVLEQRRLDELRRGIEAEATAQGGRFTSRLLSRLASPELEARIIAMVVEDLPTLAEGKKQTLRAACRESGSKVKITSAYPVDEKRQEALTRGMSDLAGAPTSCEFHQDSRVIAGVRITVGPWILRANLQDELEAFTEATHD